MKCIYCNENVENDRYRDILLCNKCIYKTCYVCCMQFCPTKNECFNYRCRGRYVLHCMYCGYLYHTSFIELHYCIIPIKSKYNNINVL